eukprot:TRINITY_DN2186_c1_g1_i2.p1 TRINITY_DN2186_c1_g1~~TRINITY_DN2186_c1_g1_i2.p1  ORF type:complete len:528 (+),score=49.80 TRINITY_DN2186_c1_g1_i2:247-1830(+)
MLCKPTKLASPIFEVRFTIVFFITVVTSRTLATPTCQEEVTIHAKDAVILSGRNDLVGLNVSCFAPCPPSVTLGWPVQRLSICFPPDSYEQFPPFARVAPEECAVNPDGNAILLNVTGAGSLSGYSGPGGALLAVFWDETTSNDTSRAPPTLSFVTAASRDYLTIEPLLGQLFFLGDAKTTNGSLQKVHSPSGATRLYFGIADGLPGQRCFGSYVDNTEDPSFPFRLCVAPLFATPSTSLMSSVRSSSTSTAPSEPTGTHLPFTSTQPATSTTKSTPTATPTIKSHRPFDFVDYVRGLRSDEFNEDSLSSIEPIEHHFTGTTSKETVVLKVVSSSTVRSGDRPLVVGVLTIPPNTFHPDCVLTIGPANETQDPSDDPCFEQLQHKQLTAVIEIETNHRCGNVTKLANTLHLQLAGEPNDDACLSFRQSETQPWACLGNSRLVQFDDKIGVYEAPVDHFTTFAALLTVSSNCTNVYWIVSLCLLGGTCLLWLLLIWCYQKNKRFRSWVRHDHAPTVSKLMKKVETRTS